MHYYQFNIADYRKDTAHLSPIEHYIYRQLMDSYYLDEKAIPKETQSVMRRLCIGSDGLEMLNNVLVDFFFLVGDEWHHKRIDAEINSYHEKAATNKENGKKGGRPRNQQLSDANKPKITQPVNSANQNESETKPNQEPKNQEPRNQRTNNNSKTKLNFESWPNEPSADILSDWKKVRQSKKAPLTQTAISRMAKEIVLAHASGFTVDDCIGQAVERGWTGFKAEWMLNCNGVEKQQPSNYKDLN
jgi:uncharacterized protein YdaU (DUF1376 family)